MSAATSTFAENRGSYSLASLLRQQRSWGILAVNSQLQVVAASQETAELFGCKAGDLTRRALASLGRGLAELALQAARSGGSTQTAIVELSPAQGHSVRAAARALATEQLAPEEGCVLVLLEALEAAPEDRLLQVDRLAKLGTLAATTAHEIKNSFVACRTFIELLLERNRDSELAEVVARELKRTDMLLSQVLRFASPAGRPSGAVGVHGVLEHAVRLVQHQASAKGVRIEPVFHAERHQVLADEYQLEQAFVNLLLNALEATGPGGFVQVRTGSQPVSSPGRAHLSVCFEDSGCGMSSEVLGRLFEPFFSTKDGGTGLGLAITERIVKDHGGAIDVETFPGKGTTFRIVLPLAEAPGGPGDGVGALAVTGAAEGLLASRAQPPL